MGPDRLLDLEGPLPVDLDDDLLDFVDKSEDLDAFSRDDLLLPPSALVPVPVECECGRLAAESPLLPEAVSGAGDANNSIRLRTYALSARATGSPSLTKLRNRLFFSCGWESEPAGFWSGIKLTGGVPNVMQWMRLKQPVRVFNSLMAALEVASMWL